MSLIITGDLGPRKCYVTNVPYYTRTGVGKHFPVELAAAFMLPEAKRQGFDEIVVEQAGQRPKSFSVLEVERMVRRNPAIAQSIGYNQPRTAIDKIKAKINRQLLATPY